jgi:hypothetical protein
MFDVETNGPEVVLEALRLRSRTICNWVCGEGHTFAAPVHKLTLDHTTQCPPCRQREREESSAEFERWCKTPITEVPELMAAWRGEVDPSTVMVQCAWIRDCVFECPHGHRPRIMPYTFMTNGCPSCRGNETRSQTVAEHRYWAPQWHPRNEGSADSVTQLSRTPVWWRSQCCGYEWEQSPYQRRSFCPNCEPVSESVGQLLPELAAEWSPRNQTSPWHVRTHEPASVEWVCAENREHVWTAPVSSRSYGAGCPDCKIAGKSRIELDHFAQASELFGNARSGQRVRSERFETGRSWVVDILVNLDAGRLLVIEYDGAYWHAGDEKIERDIRKSSDLISAGYLLVRLRENDLPSLGITSDRYLELRVHSEAPRPEATMQSIRDWIRG